MSAQGANGGPKRADPFPEEGIARSEDTFAKRDAEAGGTPSTRDTTPAVGTPGEPGSYKRCLLYTSPSPRD